MSYFNSRFRFNKKKINEIYLKRFFLIILSVISLNITKAQTSWKGITSTDWSIGSNWTAGIPNSTTDAIIGDANFTGSFQPALTANSNCKSLTIGAATKTSTLSISKNITISGTLTIGSNGTILANSTNKIITIKGNWINSGVYNPSAASPKVTFAGASQSITGNTIFKNLTINTGCILTLNNNITVNTNLTISGTLDPTATNSISGIGNMTVNSGGVILVKAADFSSNYALSGTTSLNGKSTVNYTSSTINQNVTHTLTYGYLRISGGLIKTLTGNLPALNSTSSTSGYIYVDAGTFDLLGFTANRGTSIIGGSFVMATGTLLKIGGTNTFPTNYNTKTFATTSTVEYYGNAQTVIPTTYGNLTLSSTSGAVIKTMPAISFVIAGNLTCNIGNGTGVSFTAGQNITVNRDVSIGSGCTLNTSNFSHTLGGNFTNNGTLSSGTSTITLSGINAVLSGTGTSNFNNAVFSGSGITAQATATLNMAGSISTSGAGNFTHSSGGLVIMNGTTKTISGNGFNFYHLSIPGTITTLANLNISGDLTINGSFIASDGIVTLNGTSKSISGSGVITFFNLNVTGTISTASNSTISSNLSVSLSGSFTATSGTISFNGTTSTLSGTANLYNATINATKTLILASTSILGISNVFTKTGTFNTFTNIPNLVEYNSSGVQSIINTSYYNLTMANGGTKTAFEAITVNNDFTINTGVIFNAGSYVFSLYRHFINNGSFSASTSTVQLMGTNAANITGTTTFNDLIENKSTALITVTLNNNVTTNNLTMTLGNMATGINSITITGLRTGSGIIIGTISHSHSFINGVTYYFEGPANGITFTTPTAALNLVTVKVMVGSVNDFNPGFESITREYSITIPNGTYTDAKLQLHYETNELNAYDETTLAQYHYNTGTAVWDSVGFTTKNGATNYIEKNAISNITGRWTLSGERDLIRWNGSVSSAWETASNWTCISGANMTNRVPLSTDAVEIGQASFINNPVISSTQTVSLIRFGSVQAASVTINSGASLTTVASIKGIWSSSMSHVLNVSSGSLIVGTNMNLSDGTSGHDIELQIGSGNAVIDYNLTQSASGALNFTGNGSLSVGKNYNYSSGNFIAGSGTIIYTGSISQIVAPLTYNNLSFTKSTEEAHIVSPITVNGNLDISIAGSVLLSNTLTVIGNINIGAGTSLIETGVPINVGGNWSNDGIFTADFGSVNFNGSGNQTVNATTFNNLIINKSAGELSLTDNLTINNNLSLTTGSLNLSTYNANRTNLGGVLTIGASGYLKISGANNFPDNFSTQTINANSTVEYLGTISQTVGVTSYGNIKFSNGGDNSKTLLGDIIINGDFTINSGATFNPDSMRITLYGNAVNNGTYAPAGSQLILAGTNKTITGGYTSLYDIVITGSYTISCSSLDIFGNSFIDVTGNFNLGTTTTSSYGDLTNKGIIYSGGILTFAGTRQQTFQIINAIQSTANGILNFNGTIAPIMNSSGGTVNFATININNTSPAGISPSIPWVVAKEITVAPGATIDFGSLTHTFYGNFINNGTSLSSGELRFTPIAAFGLSSATVNLGSSTYTNTGKTVFGGSIPLTLLGTNPILTNVDVTNTHTFGITPTGALTIQENLFIGAGATLYGGSNLSHIIIGDFTNNGTLNGQTSTITFTGTPSIINGIGSSVFNNITIGSLADVTLNQNINITRDFVNDGAFTPNGYELLFTGTTNSTIKGTSGTLTLDELSQDKTGGAITTLSVPIIINTKLHLLNGVINTSSLNILTLVDDAISTSGTTTSFVNGPMKKIGNDAFEFPVGNNTVWARIGMSAPVSVSSEFQAQYIASAYTNTASVTAPLDHISTIEHWILNRTVGTDNVDVTLFWENGSRSAINDLTDIVVARFNGTNWVDETQDGGVTGTTGLGTVTSQMVTSFSPFTFGSRSSTLNPLPIDLVEFKATCLENRIIIKWVTASELNNKYFLLEKSSNATNWQLLGQINGANNSTSTKYYNYQDNSKSNEITYYRLTQIDNDGKQKIYKIISVDCNTNSGDNMILYPNPASNELNADFILTQNYSEGILKIIDNFGRIIFEQKVQLLQGLNQNKISINLPSGLYSIIIYSDKLTLPAQELLVN